MRRVFIFLTAISLICPLSQAGAVEVPKQELSQAQAMLAFNHIHYIRTACDQNEIDLKMQRMMAVIADAARAGTTAWALTMFAHTAEQQKYLVESTRLAVRVGWAFVIMMVAEAGVDLYAIFKNGGDPADLYSAKFWGKFLAKFTAKQIDETLDVLTSKAGGGKDTLTNYYLSSEEGFRDFLKLRSDQAEYFIKSSPQLAAVIVAYDKILKPLSGRCDAVDHIDPAEIPAEWLDGTVAR